MSHYVIGLQAAPWKSVIEQMSGRGDWVFLDSPHQYRPRQNDRVLGFFGMTEVQLLQRCDVEVYALTHRGLAMPDAGSAWQHRELLELSRVAPLQCVAPRDAGFEPGPQALLRATRARQQRAAAMQTRGALQGPRHASESDSRPAPPSDPSVANHSARAHSPQSPPHGRIAAAHFRRMYRASAAQAAS